MKTVLVQINFGYKWIWVWKYFFHSIGVKRWLKLADDAINIGEKHEKSFKNHNGNNSFDFKNGQNPIKAM